MYRELVVPTKVGLIRGTITCNLYMNLHDY